MAWDGSLDCMGLQPGMHAAAAWDASGSNVALQALSPCGSRRPVGLQPLVCRHATQLIGCAAATAATLAAAASASTLAAAVAAAAACAAACLATIASVAAAISAAVAPLGSGVRVYLRGVSLLWRALKSRVACSLNVSGAPRRLRLPLSAAGPSDAGAPPARPARLVLASPPPLCSAHVPSSAQVPGVFVSEGLGLWSRAVGVGAGRHIPRTRGSELLSGPAATPECGELAQEPVALAPGGHRRFGCGTAKTARSTGCGRGHCLPGTPRRT